MSFEQRVREELAGVLDDLRALVAIESVGADPERTPQVERSAEAVAELIRGTGCPEVRVVRAAGGAPAVIARFPAPEGRPTVCLYAHHDVQPEGDPALWHTKPFVATTVGERMYGRGVSDDKGGFAVHLAALRAFEGRPPVGVTLFIEGEEESGSPSLTALLTEHRDALAADVYVIADSGNWTVGEPAFTTTLRGLVDCVIEVHTLDHGLHSGEFGGVVPDALTALIRLLASLHDDRGNVAVAGLVTAPSPTVDYPTDRLREEAGLLDGVEWIGDGSFTERLWAKPSISTIGLDTTSVARSSNTLMPSARAKISLRLAPGQDAHEAERALTAHLNRHVPWGAQLTVHPGETGEPSVIAFDGPYAEAAQTAYAHAWGVQPVLMGQGGSIPMIAEFQRAFPEATVLVTAVSDPDSRPHGANESLHLGDFAKACVSETLMLDAFGRL